MKSLYITESTIEVIDCTRYTHLLKKKKKKKVVYDINVHKKIWFLFLAILYLQWNRSCWSGWPYENRL
jgi:hypothetical protein